MSEPKITLDLTDVLRAFGADPDATGVFEHVIDVRTQDEKDGAALRRLREALPEGWSYTVGPSSAWPTTNGGDSVGFGAEVFPDPSTDGKEVWVRGATIAAAADACREALDARDDAQ